MTEENLDGLYYRKNDFDFSRPTLVFVHGLTGSSSGWLPYEKRLDRKYNILTFDLRGHGKSKKFRNYSDYEIKKFALDLDALVSHVGVSRFVLLGHSLGTLIVLEYLKSFSEKVSGLVLLSPVLGLEKSFSSKILRPLLGLARVLGVLPFSPKPGTHVDYTKYPNTTDWNLRRMYADTTNTSLRIHLYTLRQSLLPNQEYFVDGIHLPTLIIHGSKDTMSPVENAFDLSQKIKNSHLVLIPNADHIIALNNGAEICDALETFIESNKAVLL